MEDRRCHGMQDANTKVHDAAIATEIYRMGFSSKKSFLAAVAFALGLALWSATAVGQDDGPQSPPTNQPVDASEADRRAAEALGAPSDPQEEGAGSLLQPIERLSQFELLVAGGWLMIPIALFSLVVAIFGIERALAIRRSRVLPPELVAQLHQAIMHEGSLDPRWVYRMCQPYPSAAANVIKNAMLKIGRPHAEVEQAVRESSQREADRLYANVRPLNLATAVAPLLGLLGTVWGMIVAFSQTAAGEITANRAEELAGGIYTALVTTYAGLIVAIPSAILAHWFEGRISSLFRELDELLLLLLPKLERYEGKLRVQRRPGKDEVHGEEPEKLDGASLEELVRPTRGPAAHAESNGDASAHKPHVDAPGLVARVQPE